MKAVILLIATLAFAGCTPLLVRDENGQIYTLTSVSSRQKREDGKWFGGGGANSQTQRGTVGVDYPNGSGAKVSYAHANGYGHDVSVDAMVPVWSKKSQYGESTLNLGGGIDRHFGGFEGSHTTDKRVGLNFVHRF
ncbi:uncharacterized protein LOC115877460 [Sitophilus oryzae]|uniref:Uncharacterized protein LOC115877460 n=1 Tax=Sitophilus oryzae TaxID=7048 RepID=A0A6J2XET7_SITOR|nr:uncharacterized protein LOC115877460 [Sitophilus oryzae]